METANESSSSSATHTGSRLSRFSRLSSTFHSFWTTASILFHFNCCFQGVEEQTEEEVARFIAMSTDLEVNNSAIEEKAQPSRCDSRSKTRFTDLLEKFNTKNDTSLILSRPVEAEKGHVARLVSFFSSLEHYGGNTNDCASENCKVSLFGETVSLEAVQKTGAGGCNVGASISLEKAGSIPARRSLENDKEVVRADAHNCYREVQSGPNESAAKVFQPVQAKPAGGTGSKITELEADAGFVCVGSTSKTVQLPRVDGTKATVRLDIMVQAETGIAETSAGEIEAVCEVTQCDGETFSPVGDRCGDNREKRMRGNGFSGIRKLFRRPTRSRESPVISV